MTPKNSGKGKSFSGACKYVMHDVDAETSKRVAWTHTFNLANNDDIPSAINEMYLTAQNADFLKKEAGIRAGGRPTENPCKHISLNWSPEDNPSEAHMKKTAEHFMEYMRWGEHQAIFVAHSDKPHKHLHIVMNAIHPETGRHCDERWENNRMSAWAAEYERAQDCIRCPQRDLPYKERDKSMPRNMWTAFQQNEKSFFQAEQLLRRNSGELPENISIKDSEWKILKDIQRTERDNFFAEGKQEFSEMRRDVWLSVKKEFAPRWEEYYAAKKQGASADELREMKQGILDDRKAVFEPLRDSACRALLETRKAEYQGVLDGQREQRQTLRWHQQLGLDTSDFFQDLSKVREQPLITEDFRDTAAEITKNYEPYRADERPSVSLADDAADIADRPLGGIGSFAVSIADAFFTDLTNLGSARPEPPSRAEREDAFRLTGEDATRQREAKAKEVDDEEWREKANERIGRE
jgi:hypothetical protein